MACALFGAASWTGARWARAATELDNVPDADYIALGGQTQYAASGYIEVLNTATNSFSSATLIAPDWVLTAAHALWQSGLAVSAADVSFGQGASTTPFTRAADSVVQVVLDPAFAGNSTQGDDLALLQLSSPITNVTPALIYNSSLGTEIGQTATIVGYGFTGTGLTGLSSTTLGTRRGITNTIDAFGNQTTTGGLGGTTSYSYGFSPDIMLTDFDSPSNSTASVMGSSTPTSLEGASVGGDSGGGLFLTVNGQTYLAGVTSFISVFNNNPFSPNADGHYGDYNGYTRLSTSDANSFIATTLMDPSNWHASGGGTWASLSSWSTGTIPEYQQSTAVFGPGISAPATVTLDARWTVGTVSFNNTNSYTLAPGSSGALTLDEGQLAAAAAITDSLGNHVISAPIFLNSNLLATISGASNTLTISGNISGSGNLTVAGQGTLVLSGTNTYAASSTVSGGKLRINSTSALPAASALIIGTTRSNGIAQFATGIGTVSLSSLTINSGSSLDLGNNSLSIKFASPATDPVATISSYLATAYARSSGTHWLSTGLTSSAAGTSGLYSIGYADGNKDSGTAAQANQILVKFTLAGDANLDGSVGFADLLEVSQHYGQTGFDWAGGNFTYDPNGSVGFSDLLLIAQHYGQSFTASTSGSPPTQSLTSLTAESLSQAVPEPGGLFAYIIGTAAVLIRRRRR